MKKGNLFMFLFLVLFSLQFLTAENIFVELQSESVTQGNEFDVGIFLSSNASDIYAVEFELEYSEALVDFISISEGTLLSNNGQDQTFFDYETSYGKIYVYNLRNVSTGIFENGSLISVNFNAVSSGTCDFVLKNVVWVNSNITNDSAEIVDAFIENASLTINPISIISSSSPSNSGGGGSSSSSSIILTNETQNNETIEQFVDSNFDEKEIFEELNKSENSSKSFFPLTGRIIENITSGKVFFSWAFWFVIGLGIIAIFLLVVKHKKSFKKISEY